MLLFKSLNVSRSYLETTRGIIIQNLIFNSLVKKLNY